MYLNVKEFCVFVGTDTTGCVRIPASFCGILGFRPSHGAASMIGVLPNSQSLDTVGMILHYLRSLKCHENRHGFLGCDSL